MQIPFDGDPDEAFKYLSKLMARWLWKKPEGQSGTAEAFGFYGFGLETLFPTEDEDRYWIYPVLAVPQHDQVREPDFAEVLMRWKTYGTLIRISVLNGYEELAGMWAEEFAWHVKRDDMLAEEVPTVSSDEAFLAKLSKRQRDVIKRRMNGDTHPEIARDLNITPGLSRKYQYQGVGKLRELGAYGILRKLSLT